MRDDTSQAHEIRDPAVAGQFYPGTADALREMIEQSFLSPLGPGVLPAQAPATPAVFGVMCPHAGYLYSGPGTAWGFAAAAHQRPEAVVILGVNHQGIGAPLALSPAEGWATPLGVVPVASALNEALRTLDANLRYDAAAHAREHSLEVQLPFVQYSFAGAPIVPIVIGQVGAVAIERLGAALATLAKEQQLLIIASSDMSHYIAQAEAERRDRLAMAQVAAIDADALLTVVRRERISMCGVLPVAVLLTAGRQCGVSAGSILHYHTSGAVTGELDEVVGYGTVALYR